MLNLIQLAKKIKNEEDAVKFWQDYDILHKSRKCTRKHEMHLKLSPKNKRWVCRRRNCRVEKGLRNKALSTPDDIILFY